jgi:glycosyltransferase involved in cell wall biosynthesis
LGGTIDSGAGGGSPAAPAAPAAVIVAAHDEADRIGATLAALSLAFPGARLWVADDASADATASIAQQAGVEVQRARRRLGKGGAVSRAAAAALAEGAACDPEDVFVLCDGDLGSSAARLGALVDAVAAGDGDVAVARFARSVGGGVGLARGFAAWAIRRRCGLVTSAPISGQRALSRSALQELLPFADGYGMELGMTIDAVRAGRRVIEVELDLSHRATGRSAAGFAHRGRQLVDFVRAYLARR